MEITDFYLAPFYLLIIYAIANRFRNKHYPEGHPLRRYFIPGLTVKMVGAVTTGLIYWFYYEDGDTIYYYERSKLVYDLFMDNPSLGFSLIFSSMNTPNSDLWGYLYALRAFDTSSYMVVRIGSLMAIPAFGNYTIIAFMFASFCFSGVWKLFRVFAEMYPDLTRQMAIACLFIPSVFFWGSGIFKDTIALGGLGWLTFASYKLFIKKEKKVKAAIVAAASLYLVVAVKAYIVMCFVPALLFWIFFTRQANIKNNFLKFIATPFILVVTVGFAFIFMNQVGEQNSYWALDQMQDRAKDMQWWHTRVVELYGEEGGGGSYYSIGNGEFTLSNLLPSFPIAVITTLYRPFLWEVGSLVMFIAAVESLVFLIFTIRVLFRAGIARFIKITLSNPLVFFSLFFAIIFAFAVGFTSFNFGALVRYKIPCLPFYLAALYIIQYEANKAKAPVERARPQLAVS